MIAMTSDNAEVQDTVRRVVRMIFTSSNSKSSGSRQEQQKATPAAKEQKAEEQEAHEELVAPKIVERPRYSSSVSVVDNGDSDFNFGGSEI